MAYTITFEKEPDKLVYFAGNPIEYLVKVAYGGGDNIPATMVLNFNVVQNGITYNQTITKTVKYFSGNNAFFYFDLSGVVSQYVFPVLEAADIKDTDALQITEMDCYIGTMLFFLYVEDTDGLIVVEGSPSTPTLDKLGIIRGLFQYDNDTRDIDNYIFVGTSGATSLLPLTTRPDNGNIGVDEWEVFSIGIIGDIAASSQPCNALRVTCYYTGLTTTNNLTLNLPNNTVIKDNLYYLIPCGTANVAAAFPFGTTALQSYKCEVGYLSGGGTFMAKYAGVTRKLTNCLPESKVYFYNSLGGVDCFNFYRSRNDVFRSDSETFTKQQPSFFYDDISLTNTGTEKLRALSFQSTKLETLCTQEEYEWLAKELLTSTKAFLQVSDFGIDNPYLYPVIVTSSEAESYNWDTGELYASFEFQYANERRGL